MSEEAISELTRSYWHLIAHRSEVAKNRDFLRLSWVFGDLTVYNDRGNIIAFDNLCPHRGTRLFLDEAGNAAAVCPYHGWSYRDGEVHIPNRASYGSNQPDACLNTFDTAWCGDFLFVAIAPKQDLPEQIGNLQPTLTQISQAIARRHDLNRYDYECYWRVAVENALEADHVPMVHPNTLASLELSPGTIRYEKANSTMHAEIGNERMRKRLNSFKRLFRDDPRHEGYLSLFLFPFTFITSTFGYSYSLQNFFPSREPRRTHFLSRLLVARTASDEAENATRSFFDSVSELNRAVFAEDHAICKRVSPDYSFGGQNRFCSSAEEQIQHLQQSLISAGYA